jgi:hypothetical protein
MSFNIRWILNPPVIWALMIFVMVSFLPWGISGAQENNQYTAKGKHLGLHLGTGIASYREDLLVPLGFSGPGFSLGPIYTRQTENSLVQIRLKVGLGYLKNRYSHEAWVLMLEIRPSWMRKFAKHDRYGQFWGGISVPLQMNNLFLESWDESHLYWLTAHSLGAAFQWEKKISPKNHAVFIMEVPVFSLISRPPTYRYNKQDALTRFTFHFTEPNSSLHLETLDTYRALFIQALLRREVRRSLFTIGLEFQYSYCREPERIWGINTSIFASYQWRIGK